MDPRAAADRGERVKTRGEEMLALRKRRMVAAHPFLRGGFRPFFFGAAAWAVIAIGLWLAQLAGTIALPTRFEPVAWHRHEMVFGFVGAAICGFLLTAIPNWTGRLPIAGKPLLSLFGLWVAARIAVLISDLASLWLAAVLEVGLFLALALLAGREVMGSNKRNVPLVALVFLFALADAADFLQGGELIGGDYGWRGGIALVILMISLIGGRIIPSFTRNWLVKSGIDRALPTQPQKLDLLIIASTALALLFWLVFPHEKRIGAMLILASLAQALRLLRWGGVRALPEPLVFVLHAGYAWVAIGLLLLGLTLAGADLPRSAGIHALTVGAMATMILAVMSRASLGHTGRELRANPLTLAAYVLVTAGAALRVGASLNWVDFRIGIDLAGALWIAAFFLFLVVYGPILIRARVDDQ